jgi:hypothetical protein
LLEHIASNSQPIIETGKAVINSLAVNPALQEFLFGAGVSLAKNTLHYAGMRYIRTRDTRGMGCLAGLSCMEMGLDVMALPTALSMDIAGAVKHLPFLQSGSNVLLGYVVADLFPARYIAEQNFRPFMPFITALLSERREAPQNWRDSGRP